MFLRDMGSATQLIFRCALCSLVIPGTRGCSSSCCSYYLPLSSHIPPIYNCVLRSIKFHFMSWIKLLVRTTHSGSHDANVPFSLVNSVCVYSNSISCYQSRLENLDTAIPPTRVARTDRGTLSRHSLLSPNIRGSHSPKRRRHRMLTTLN